MDTKREYLPQVSFWTLSNSISVLRIALVVPLVWFLITDRLLLAFYTGIFAYLTDIADGYLARLRNEISEWGKIIDPLADKVFVGTGAVLMAWLNIVPLWFFACVAARDIIILVAGLWAKSKTGVVLPSNYTGKAAVVVVAFSMGSVLANAPVEIQYWSRIFATIMMGVSLASYGVRFYKDVIVPLRQQSEMK